jgi:hypothetical protein
MGIPRRFVIEYPQRALQLIDAMEAYARRQELLGSFGLLAAASVLTMPYERMKPSHFLHPSESSKPMAAALRSLKRSRFLDAPFWQGRAPGDWRMSRIMMNIHASYMWTDEIGRHPFAPDAVNKIESRDAESVLRVIRNALAHGNVVYLDENGHETPGHQLRYLAFLSRYEESPEQRGESQTYRIVATTEEEFLTFIRYWAKWVASLSPELKMMAA